MPFPWDRNAPSFESEEADDLMTFVDHVDQILELAGITDDAERKKRLVSYLSVKKNDIWKGLPSYEDGTYEKFLSDVYKIYPEVKSTRVGSIDALNKLCKKYRYIAITDEGILKRFGAEFQSMVKKLLAGKAI
ncbi:hypothetical protein K438DRAFT_1520413, partial [Mycena galopus ATCC 62051]